MRGQESADPSTPCPAGKVVKERRQQVLGRERSWTELMPLVSRYCACWACCLVVAGSVQGFRGLDESFGPPRLVPQPFKASVPGCASTRLWDCAPRSPRGPACTADLEKTPRYLLAVFLPPSPTSLCWVAQGDRWTALWSLPLSNRFVLPTGAWLFSSSHLAWHLSPEALSEMWLLLIDYF